MPRGVFTIADAFAAARVDACKPPDVAIPKPGPCKGAKKKAANAVAKAVKKAAAPAKKAAAPATKKAAAVASPSRSQIEKQAADFAAKWDAAKPPSRDLVPINDLDQLRDIGRENGHLVSGVSLYEVVEGLRKYKGPGYRDINRALRNEEPAFEINHNVSGLDAALRLSQVKDDLKVFRGMQLREMWPDRFDENLEGMEWLDKGYTSTTRNWEKTEAFDPDTVLRIVVPKGTSAVQILENASDEDWEEELLLQRGLTYRIVKDHGFEGPYRRLDVAIVPKEKP